MIDVAGKDPNNPNDPVSTYSIDGTSTRYVGERSQTIIQHGKLFFRSPKLEEGEHTLVITSTGHQGRLIIDYIQFVPITSELFVHKYSLSIVTSLYHNSANDLRRNKIIDLSRRIRCNFFGFHSHSYNNYSGVIEFREGPNWGTHR